MAASIRDVWDGRIFITLTRNVNRGTREMRLRVQDAQAAAVAGAVLTAGSALRFAPFAMALGKLGKGQVIGQTGVGGLLIHFEAPTESGWVCHPGVLKKSAEPADCKRVVKHSWFQERKERDKERS
jgi:hypothetical protein